MKNTRIAAAVLTILISLQIGYAQNKVVPPKPNPTPRISETAAKNLLDIALKTKVSRERREQAYVKLLEAQRNWWEIINRPRSSASTGGNFRLAKQALQKAIEFDPALDETYTALAELIFGVERLNGLEEAVLFADIAVKINPNNFGGHRLLAQLYTIRSRREDGSFEPVFVRRAIDEWKEVARLDARNAEAFAFLSEFYAQTNKPAERIDALRRWLAAAAPLDSRFYRAVFGGRADLSPETATVKFGQALLETGEMREAIEILSRAVADNPENEEAIELLRQAIETADETSAATAAQALRQAAYANPENAKLVVMLARVQARAGKRSEALQLIRALRAKTPADGELVKLEARILAEDGKIDEAVALVKSLDQDSGGVGSGSGDETIAIGNPISAAVGNQLYISELYTLAKRPKEAVQAVSQALPLAKTKYEKEVVKLTLATMQQSSGDFNGAETTLRETLKESPRNSIALNNLGYFLAERGEKLDEALKLIQQALEIEPNNPSYLDSLGWAFFKLGNLPEAEKNLKAALKYDDTSSTVHEHLGDVYQKQGKLDSAKTAWNKALTLTTDADETNRLKTKLETK